MAGIRLVRGFLTVGAWTMASRVLGFVRDIVIAAALGAGPVAEAFVVAFSLPNMFRRFFAEGAFNMAFVPMFAKRLEAGDDPHGFAEDAFKGLSAVLFIFTILGTLAMPWLVWAMASGFAGDERFTLAVLFGRIGFSYIMFISLVALLSGVLNAFGRFTEASLVPVLMNLMFILAMWLASWMGWDMGLTLAWTVPVTGVAQFLFTWFAARQVGYTLTPGIPRMTPALKRLLIIAGPAVLSGGVVQINLIVGRQVASFTEGAVAWLSYADRLYQLPLGVIGIAIGTVLLPDLSRRLRAGDHDGGRHSLSRAGEIALALTVPAAVALIVVPLPMVTVLFERGRFTSDDSAATAQALMIYGLGLPSFVLQKVLQPVYYARENTRTPFYFALVSMVVNAGIAIGLSPVIGYTAAAFGTTLAGWAMVALLWIGAARMGEQTSFDSRFWRRLWRIGAASWAMGAVLWVLALWLGPLFYTPGWRVIALAVLVTLGALSYFGLGQLFRAFRMSDLKSAMKR